MRQTVLAGARQPAEPHGCGPRRVIPSVILKVDVGDPNPSSISATVHGSANENGFLIEGMDVSNLDGNGSQATLYLDPYVFGNQLSDGKRQHRGVESWRALFNVITRTGTNKIHGGAMFNGANHGMGQPTTRRFARAASRPCPGRARRESNLVPGADILKI
jgi:hypothetical protein